MFGDNFAKEFQSMPLSNDSVSRLIDITEDVEQQLFGKLREKLFSMQLDEATYCNKDAHFIAYVRIWDEGWEKKINRDVKIKQITKTPTKNGEGGRTPKHERSNEAERWRGEGRTQEEIRDG
ncbi:SCAN domain-containing protein 3 [Trichonephila clavipes]|nr:SCAN domain-containing protein 3 [Trichonephila clavipes]